MICSSDGADALILKSAKDVVVAGLVRYGRSPIQALADVLLRSLEDAVEDLDDNFTGKLEELEETNTEIVGLITDIRLTLAKLPE